MVHSFHASPTVRRPRSLLLATLGTVFLGLSGCTSLHTSEMLRPAVGHVSWLQLQGGHSTEVSAGLFLELPQAPYRARFSDATGTFYQASRPLVYRTQQGSTVSVPGGLYVLHHSPHEARSWTEPVFFTPTMVNPTVYRVQVFAGS